MTVTDQDPILVTGADRSGTSLMFALLASHPNIAMVRRTNLWRWFHGAFGDLRQPANLDRCLQAMLRYDRLRHLDPDPEALRRELAAGPMTYGRLFALLHAQHAMRAGKPRWGDKSLHTEHHADVVLTEWPHARIIHMVRDPRDRFASIAKRYRDRTKQVGTALGRWLASAQRGARNRARYADRYLLVRYETLARAPEQTLRSVCAFIGEDYHPDMLRMDGAPEHGDEGGNSSFERFAPGVISTRSIGRFTEILAARELAFIQLCARRPMLAHGYTPQPVHLGAIDRAAFLAGYVPPNLARLGSAFAREWRGARPEGGVPAHRLAGAGPDGGRA